MDGLVNVYARNCELRRITRPRAAAFLDANHRLGSTGGRYHYGLFVRRTTGRREIALPAGEMVAVSSFSGPRLLSKPDGGRSRSCEWIRYASLKGVRVVGGMSRMLSRFVEDVSPDDVMTYADLSWPDGGEVYRKLGFKAEKIVERPAFRCLKYRLTL